MQGIKSVFPDIEFMESQRWEWNGREVAIFRAYRGKSFLASLKKVLAARLGRVLG